MGPLRHHGMLWGSGPLLQWLSGVTRHAWSAHLDFKVFNDFNRETSSECPHRQFYNHYNPNSSRFWVWFEVQFATGMPTAGFGTNQSDALSSNRNGSRGWLYIWDVVLLVPRWRHQSTVTQVAFVFCSFVFVYRNKTDGEPASFCMKIKFMTKLLYISL